MKFTIDKNILLENLTKVSKAISNRNIIPILNGIKFELTNEGLRLTASDSELIIQTFIEAKEIKQIETEGIFILQSKYLLDIIRKMPSNEINFEVVDGVKVKIFTNTNQYNLNCLDANEYPKLRLENSKSPIAIESQVFKNIIHQTSFAISTQESRPVLTGINLKIVGDLLECIATDSYRLAKKTIKLSTTVEENINIIIPGKNINELDKILSDEGMIELHVFGNKIIFKFYNVVFQTNLLNGTYPNTQNLIPTEFSIIVNTKLSNFMNAVDRAAVLTQNKDKNIVKMNIERNKMVISSFASEIGKVEEELAIENNGDNNLEIAFSAKYMLDALKTIEEEDILILLNSNIKPIIIKSVKDETLIQLILPIKTY